MDRDCAVAAVITNLFLPDSQGLETIARIFEVAPHIPILVLANPDTEHIARQAIGHGAQDYLLQHRLDSYSLPRMLHNMLYRVANRIALSAGNERARSAPKSIDDAVCGHLTGSTNVASLEEPLSRAIATTRRLRESLAVLCVHVDRFDHVNHASAQAIDDQLRRSIGERLASSVRCSDTVSPQDDGEFLVVLHGLSHATDAALSAERILASLSAPHGVAKHHLQVAAAIGIGVYPDDGNNTATLVANARIAVCAAKEQGPNSYVFLKPHFNELAFERRFLQSGLRHAPQRGEFASEPAL
jgi:diguanylate cyclase (GGDEF)-like protein